VLKLSEKTIGIYFRVALLTGDNLGIHSISDLVESFGVIYPCRVCKEPKVIATQTVANKDMLRTRENYEIGVLIGIVSVTGVKGRSWNDIRTFHATGNWAQILCTMYWRKFAINYVCCVVLHCKKRIVNSDEIKVKLLV